MPTSVDPAKCDACEECVDTCPTDSIEIKDEKAKIDPEECIDCEACIDACPNDAITMTDD